MDYQQRKTGRAGDQAPTQAERLAVQRDDERTQEGKLPQCGDSTHERQERDQDTLQASREPTG